VRRWAIQACADRQHERLRESLPPCSTLHPLLLRPIRRRAAAAKPSGPLYQPTSQARAFNGEPGVATMGAAERGWAAAVIGCGRVSEELWFVPPRPAAAKAKLVRRAPSCRTTLCLACGNGVTRPCGCRSVAALSHTAWLRVKCGPKTLESQKHSQM